ncbi:putative sugar nucleotidyl transferase [Gemmatimonas sp.]|uniref:putative sugar nucleotidyl transferase n=1 Tax=Gemmatimonas sp. TaxID=1962908 RepID=UPI00286E1684|nr:putative sugar nucleotidyl transferase [Gemmatimonas sp.]
MIALYDDAVARRFEPFATSRPLGEMRAGALLIRERWEMVLGVESRGFVAAPHLHGFAEFDAPAFVNGQALAAGTWLVNTRALPFLDGPAIAVSPTALVVTIGGRIAARRLDGDTFDERILASLADGSHELAHDRALPDGTGDEAEALDLDGVWLNDVWDVIGTLQPLLQRDIPVLGSRLSATTLQASSGASVTVIGAHPVLVEAGATVEPMSVFDTSAGPVLLRRGAQVQAFTRVIGPCYVGRDSVVTADRIAGSSIGDTCRVHGELSTSIFIGHANKGHDGFVGHSVLGRWVNLGAGTITSNLMNTYGTVALWTPDGVRDSGLQFLGTMFGDHVKTGIGLRLTTGCVLGAGANVFDTMPPKAVAPFSWGARAPYEPFDATKFVQTAERMMARRGVSLSEGSRVWWTSVHALCAADSRWPRR